MKISPIKYNTYFVNFSANKNFEEDVKSAKYGVLNHYSCFFRDFETNEFLKKYIIKNFSTKPELNIVSMGVSSGEEAYSIAMMLDDIKPKVNIQGFDVDEDSINQAQRGIYELNETGSEKYLPTPEFIFNPFENECAQKFNRYFERLKGRIYGLKPGQLKNCSFFKGDILKIDELFQKNSTDIIFCRNTLYHLANCQQDKNLEDELNSRDTLYKIAKNMNRMLNEDGLVVFSQEEFQWGLDTIMLDNVMKKNGFEPVETDGKLRKDKLRDLYFSLGIHDMKICMQIMPNIYKKIYSV